jgi:hypothetical protein
LNQSSLYPSITFLTLPILPTVLQEQEEDEDKTRAILKTMAKQQEVEEQRGAKVMARKQKVGQQCHEC